MYLAMSFKGRLFEILVLYDGLELSWWMDASRTLVVLKCPRGSVHMPIHCRCTMLGSQITQDLVPYGQSLYDLPYLL